MKFYIYLIVHEIESDSRKTLRLKVYNPDPSLFTRIHGSASKLYEFEIPTQCLLQRSNH